jgi:hypothetical protein
VKGLVLGGALLVVLAGCESARSPAPPGPISDGLLQELVGTWIGTWGETPLTLVVVEHTASAPYSGLYVGPWLVAGGSYPGISGVLTYTRSGAPASVRFNGWIASTRPVMIRIQAEPPDGRMSMSLRGDGAVGLVGEGESTFYWGPQGPVALTRR